MCQVIVCDNMKGVPIGKSRLSVMHMITKAATCFMAVCLMLKPLLQLHFILRIKRGLQQRRGL